MKIIILTILLLLLLLVRIQGKVLYQLHSYNDVNEWESVFSKGVTPRWLKIDPHFVPDQQLCESFGLQGDRGCIVYNHDTPVAGGSYNTTADIAAFMKNYRERFFQAPNAFFIALCLKKPGSADPCSANSDLLYQADAVIDQLTRVVEEEQLAVEFVLDGSYVPSSSHPCLMQRWRPLNATYIYELGDSNWEAAFSNNVTLAYDRFQVLNEPEFRVVDPAFYLHLAKMFNYGKFASTKYPYLFWEPSDERPIQDVVKVYADGPQHPPGLRFAINIDPIQFEIYSSYNMNESVALHYRSNFTSDGNPLITAHAGGWYSLLYPQAGGLQAVTFQLDAIAEATAYTVIGLLLQDVASVTSMVDTGKTLMTSQGALGQFFELHNGQLTADSLKFNLMDLSTHDVDASSTFTRYGESGRYIFTAAIQGDDRCFKVVANQLLNNDTQIRHQAVSDCLLVEGATSIDLVARPTRDTIDVLLAFAYSNATVSLMQLQLSFSEGTQPTWKYPYVDEFAFAPGTSAELQISPNDNVMLLVQDGNCWNNEQLNKDAHLPLCAATPSSHPGLLNYHYGPFDSFILHLAKQIPFSACDSTVLSGSYDNGSSAPSATFSPSSSAFVATHSGLPSSFHSPQNCGTAIHHHGIIMDSWIPHFN